MTSRDGIGPNVKMLRGIRLQVQRKKLFTKTRCLHRRKALSCGSLNVYESHERKMVVAVIIIVAITGVR